MRSCSKVKKSTLNSKYARGVIMLKNVLIWPVIFTGFVAIGCGEFKKNGNGNGNDKDKFTDPDNLSSEEEVRDDRKTANRDELKKAQPTPEKIANSTKNEYFIHDYKIATEGAEVLKVGFGRYYADQTKNGRLLEYIKLAKDNTNFTIIADAALYHPIMESGSICSGYELIEFNGQKYDIFAYCEKQTDKAVFIARFGAEVHKIATVAIAVETTKEALNDKTVLMEKIDKLLVKKDKISLFDLGTEMTIGKYIKIEFSNKINYHYSYHNVIDNKLATRSLSVINEEDNVGLWFGTLNEKSRKKVNCKPEHKDCQNKTFSLRDMKFIAKSYDDKNYLWEGLLVDSKNNPVICLDFWFVGTKVKRSEKEFLNKLENTLFRDEVKIEKN